jgi:hypothetical protein
MYFGYTGTNISEEPATFTFTVENKSSEDEGSRSLIKMGTCLPNYKL